MQAIAQVSNFVPSGSPAVSKPTGMYGLGILMNLPTADASNLQLSVTNGGEHTLQVVIGAASAVAFDYSGATGLRIRPNKTALLTGIEAVGASTATQVSVSSSAPGCVATFQRGSLTASQVAA